MERDPGVRPEQRLRHVERNRLSRMIQLEAGNEMMAEPILFTGKCSLEFPRDACQKPWARGGATRPVDEDRRH